MSTLSATTLSPSSIIEGLNNSSVFSPIKSPVPSPSDFNETNTRTSFSLMPPIAELPPTTGKLSVSATHSSPSFASGSVSPIASPAISFSSSFSSNSTSPATTTPTMMSSSSSIETADAPSNVPVRKIRVLLIDDQELHQKMLTKNLEQLIAAYQKEKYVKFSLTIETADCADAGLRLLKSQFYDLTVWDNQMPNKYGIVALKEFADYVFTDEATPSAVKNFFNPPLFYTADSPTSFTSADLSFLETSKIEFLKGKQGEIPLKQKLAFLKAVFVQRGIFN